MNVETLQPVTHTCVQVQTLVREGLRWLWSEEKRGWAAFSSSVGPSTEWATSHILADLGLFQGHLQRGRRVIRELKAPPISAFNPDSPPDADSTAMLCIASHLFSIEISVTAFEFLWAHRVGEGGFATFVPDSLRPFPRYFRDGRIGGWCRKHDEVTASVLEALLLVENPWRERALADLREILRNQGRAVALEPYWWTSSLYSAYRWSRTIAAGVELDRSLSLVAGPLGRRIGNRVTEYVSRMHTSPHTWDTALAISCLGILGSLMGSRQAADDHVALLGRKLTDTLALRGFPVRGREILRVPAPEVENPDDVRVWNIDRRGMPKILSDIQGYFTTAQTVLALSFALEVLEREGAS